MAFTGVPQHQKECSVLVLCISVSVHPSLKRRVTKLLEASGDLSATCRNKQTFTIALASVDKLKLSDSQMCMSLDCGRKQECQHEHGEQTNSTQTGPSRKCCEATMQVTAGLSINQLLFIKR